MKKYLYSVLEGSGTLTTEEIVLHIAAAVIFVDLGNFAAEIAEASKKTAVKQKNTAFAVLKKGVRKWSKKWWELQGSNL